MTADAKPLVSVLVPAYNAQATLAETLQSALTSSYSAIELLVVDDGSTDRTSAIAEEMARRDKRVSVFRQAHGGVSAALNRGLAEVRGDYVARLDADDLWQPTKLEKQVDLMAADPTVALVYTFVRYVDGNGRVVRDAPPQRLAGFALCQCLYNGILGGGSSILFRRPILERTDGYDETLSIWEDLLLHLHVAAAGAIAFIPEYLTAYRRRSDSSSTDLCKSLANWRIARRRVQADFPQVPAFVERWSHARRLLELAEGFAFDGCFARAAKLLVECLLSDFTRTSNWLAYRLNRKLRGNRSPVDCTGPLFAECDVNANYMLTRFDAALEGTRIRMLDQSRGQLLQSIDHEIAAAGRSI